MRCLTDVSRGNNSSLAGRRIVSRKFLLTRYSEPIIAMQLNLTELPDDFDLLLGEVTVRSKYSR